jgi:hypothetical protein
MARTLTLAQCDMLAWQPAVSPPHERVPLTDDADAWKSYWQAQGTSWRTEPDINGDRQAYLAERRSKGANAKKGGYPFKDIEPTPTRADIEWLLETHDDRRGPLFWEDENDKCDNDRRVGLDLRGADLRGMPLMRLPLARTRGGFTIDEWLSATKRNDSKRKHTLRRRT